MRIIRCKYCKHRDPEDKKCDSGHGIIWQLPRDDDWFCADAEEWKPEVHKPTEWQLKQREYFERRKAMAKMRKAGHSYAEIGRMYGITGSVVKIHVEQVETEEKIENAFGQIGFRMNDQIDKRVINILLLKMYGHISYHATADEIIEALRRCVDISDEEFLESRNAGAKTLFRLHEIQKKVREQNG